MIVHPNTPPANTATTVVGRTGTYEDAYKHVRPAETFRMLKYLFGISFVIAVLFQTKVTFNYHTILALYSFKTLSFALRLFGASLLICLLRKVTLTFWEPTYPSYLAEVISRYTYIDNFVLLGCNIISSLYIIRFYFSSIVEEKQTLSFLIHPPGNFVGTRQINQDNIFVCVYAVTLAINYTCDFLKDRRHVVKASNIQQPFGFAFKTSLATLACNSAIRALYSFRNAYVAYIFCNGTLYYYAAHFFGYFNRVLDSPIGGFQWINVHLFLRLVIAGMLTTTVYNVAHRLFDLSYSSIVSYTDLYANQFECLISGLAEENKAYLKIAAYRELATIVNKRPEKRVGLFNTVGKELQDSAWYKVVTQCLKVINELRTAIDIEYNGVKKAPAPAPVSVPVDEQQIRDRLVLSKENVLAAQKRKQTYYDDRTSQIFGESTELAERELSEKVPTVVERIKAESIASFNESDMIRMIKRLELQFGYAGHFEALYAETVTRRMQTVFNKYQLSIWAIQILGGLTAASLEEDPFGLAQNDISLVLNSLLGCLTDVELYVNSPPAQYEKLVNEHQVVGETRAVILALREAIYQICMSFELYNDVFKIEEKYTKKWEQFLNFQE